AAATPNPVSNRVQEYQLIGGVPTFQRNILLYNDNSTTAVHTVDWIGFKPGASGAERHYLYINTGDGGPQANNPGYANHSQYFDNVQGKILRVDVSGGDDYPADANKNFAIPPSNPFVGQAGKLGEIAVTGFRNPYRASFDRATGDLYVGDVGFNTVEEVDFIRSGTLGQDFGWPTREGLLSPPPDRVAGVAGPPPGTIMIDPITTRTSSTADDGVGDSAIVGGYVYRGPIAELQGKYIFADHITHHIYMGDFDRNTDPSAFNGNTLTD